MKWFGDNWGAPICDEVDKVPTPLTERCFHCGGSFMRLDRGFMLPFSSVEGTMRPSTAASWLVITRIVCAKMSSSGMLTSPVTHEV
jgi:hypothetical protein